MSADNVIAGIDKFTSCPASNSCKLNVTHYGKSGKNGFSTSWVTEGGDIKENDELLNGLGPQVDTAQEKIDGRLSSIYFIPYGDSCVNSVIIACGNEVVPGTGYIKINYEDMNEAFQRKGGSRHIETDAENKCVRFHKGTADDGYTQMNINADVFACEKSDQQCILSHLEMY